ncbi:MAG: hypothetical protein A3D92_14360 [Bacteroidetes bacterium RIFCSPHIGHO2_02_FULL_44_7]|nr:MAG: hypothetical protein A3D92_14360 [Bacteroidetes bacterium RIFCSPHIGHO2_02_FULL_44_7]
MTALELGNITIEVDKAQTKEFYARQNGFTCTCRYCLNYVEKIGIVGELLNGLDLDLGIDLRKNVGQGMDELMGHDNDDHCLFVIPYYISGKCFVDGKELPMQRSGPIWPTTVRAEHSLTSNLSLVIINTSGDIEFEKAEGVLSIWLEYKSELIL